METKMLFSGMSYKIVKRKKIEVAQPGRRSELSHLKADLFKIKPGQRIIVPPGADLGLTSRRMRINVQHWKTRDGLKPISVRRTKDGNVALEVSRPKKRKGARVAYRDGLENR